MNTTETISLSRERAAFAYAEVSGWEKSPWKDQALASIKGLPIDVRTQGICVTLAVLLSSNQLHENILADRLGRWVLDYSPGRPLKPWENRDKHPQPGQRLLAACIEADRYAYMAAQNEAYKIVEQFKLFAGALYGK